jgi:hypothetical protein
MHHHYRFERGTRYYEIYILPNLFCENDMITVHGRIGSKLGRVRIKPLNEQLINKLIKSIKQRRINRGYKEIMLSGKT